MMSAHVYSASPPVKFDWQSLMVIGGSTQGPRLMVRLSYNQGIKVQLFMMLLRKDFILDYFFARIEVYVGFTSSLKDLR